MKFILGWKPANNNVAGRYAERGACEHAGFGLGFERLTMFVTGMGNVRDVIAFPRTPNNCEF